MEDQKVIKSVIDSRKEFFHEISKKIWESPELCFKEFKAHDLLTKSLEDEGFKVTKEYVLPTAFRAEYPSGKVSGPVIAVICEYDALPDIGHGCGHNLIAEAGLAAGFAIKAVLQSNKQLNGKVVVLGTPAEEKGNGKIHLINAGAFQDIDIAMMVHPSPCDHLYPPFIAYKTVTVHFKGLAAHASGYPWEGINALDAAVASYNNVAQLRQHIKPNQRIHGVIEKGGAVPNIIPEEARIKFTVRSATLKDLKLLCERVVNCFEAAALATDCEMTHQFDAEVVNSLMTNRVIAEMYKKHAEPLGVKFQDGNSFVIPFMASSDMGNVSHTVPSIHPTFSINNDAPNHSIDFTNAAGSDEAQPPTLSAAKAMAMIALEIYENPALLIDIKASFQKDLIKD